MLDSLAVFSGARAGGRKPRGAAGRGTWAWADGGRMACRRRLEAEKTEVSGQMRARIVGTL